MKMSSWLRRRRAVTLTELLVVLAIVSLLATIAVPVYLNQIQRARIATAQMEVRTIAEAQQQVGIAHGFFVPIHILDNIPNRESGSGVGGSAGNRDDFDALGASSSNLRLIDLYTKLTDQQSTQLTLASNGQRVVNLIRGWQGPFLNPRRVWYVGTDSSTGLGGNLQQDLVIDPWGNPYRMYSDLGRIGSAALPTTANPDPLLTMDNGEITTSEADRFDRFAVVSFGPDGLSGFTTTNPLQQGDDIFYTFSAPSLNESNYQPF